jgi:hypothetical protein
MTDTAPFGSIETEAVTQLNEDDVGAVNTFFPFWFTLWFFGPHGASSAAAIDASTDHPRGKSGTRQNRACASGPGQRLAQGAIDAVSFIEDEHTTGVVERGVLYR